MFKNKKKFMNIFRRKNKFERFYDNNEEFIKYCLVSAVCTVILYLVFFLVDLISNGNYLLANFFSYTISFSVLYVWDQKIFKSRPKKRTGRIAQLITFIIIRVVGFPLDSLVLHILISNFNMGNMLAKVLGSLIMFIYNYLTNKLFVFNKNKI